MTGARAVAVALPLLVLALAVPGHGDQTTLAVAATPAEVLAQECSTGAPAGPAAVQAEVASGQPRPGFLTMEQIAGLVRDAGYERDYGRDVAVAFVATLWHESGQGEIRAKNPRSTASGIAQILKWNWENLDGDPFDPVDALRMSKELSDERDRAGRHPLGPWESYNQGHYRRNMAAAEAAYTNLGGAAPAAPAEPCAPAGSGGFGLTDFPVAKPGPWGGHGNGQIPGDALCWPEFSGVPKTSIGLLRCDAARALEEVNSRFKARTGRDVRFGNGYRSYQQQREMYYGKPGPALAAFPGTSNHGWALAVDFGEDAAGYAVLYEVTEGTGWFHPRWARPGGSRPERWHWEFGEAY